MSKNRTRPERLSPAALEVLKHLHEAAEQGAPFQPLDDVNKVVLTSLVKRDLIIESVGVDSSVKYQITGRGKMALNNHYLDTSNAHKKKNTVRRVSCEECLHRYVLDCVRERLPLVDDLQAAFEALEHVQVTGGAREKLARIEEINAYAAQVEETLSLLSKLAALTREGAGDETL